MLDLNFKPEIDKNKRNFLSFIPILILSVLLIVLLFLYFKQRGELKSLKTETPIVTEETTETGKDSNRPFDPTSLILRGIVGKDSIFLVLLEDLNSAGYILRDGDVLSDWIVRYPGGDSVALISIKGDRKIVLKLGGGISEKTLP